MEWNFRDAHLMTRWASNIDRNSPLPEYPRPHMERKEWYSLNGLWEYAITSKKLSSCEHWEGQILVPYPLESALSGVMKALKPTEYLWYRRHFQPLDRWKINETMRVLLHFGAVDWECTIFVNGGKVGSHKGEIGRASCRERV